MRKSLAESLSTLDLRTLKAVEFATSENVAMEREFYVNKNTERNFVQGGDEHRIHLGDKDCVPTIENRLGFKSNDSWIEVLSITKSQLSDGGCNNNCPSCNVDYCHTCTKIENGHLVPAPEISFS